MFFMAFNSFADDYYSWEDKDGYHITDDLGKVPPKYRGKYTGQSESRTANASKVSAKSTKSITSADEQEFEKLCKAHIYNQLKAPATSRFSQKHALKTNWYKGKYVVGFDVDAQNSYGALIRTGFTCLINTESKTIDELITL